MRVGLRRRVGVLVALLALATMTVPPAVGAFTVYSAKIIASNCNNSDLPWKGDVPYDNAAVTQYEQTKGTVSWCVYFYRITDSDPYGDYYLIAESADWSTTYNAQGYYPPDNYGKVRITSSIAAKDNVKDVDPNHNITLNEQCSADYSIGVNYLIFSGGVTERFCTHGTLNLESFTTSAGQWGSPDVTLTPQWETMYMLKVAQGAKPLLIATLTYPYYQIYRDSSLYWRFTKSWQQVVTSWQTR